MEKPKMTIHHIKSRRNWDWSPHWHLVYEWEDGLAKGLGAQIKKAGLYERFVLRYFFSTLNALKLTDLFHRISGFPFRLFRAVGVDKLYNAIIKPFMGNKLSLQFEMYPRRYYSSAPMYNTIPYIIDFDYGVDLQKFYYNYRNCPLILISGRNAYNHLRNNNCPLNIAHLPLSLSDKYKEEAGVLFEKKYDIFIGKQNAFLKNCFDQFMQKYPDVHYVMAQRTGNNFYYVSNKNGGIGDFVTRESFIGLLTQCKVALYHTSGIDLVGKHPYIDHVTSRLFEYVYAQCFVVGRYPQNDEVAEFEIDKVCPAVNSYEEFEQLMLTYLCSDIREVLPKYRSYLAKNYTSERVKMLQKILSGGTSTYDQQDHHEYQSTTTT